MAIGDLVREAAGGQRGDDQKRIADVGLAWLELMLRKNQDYGSTAWSVPVLTPSLDPGTGILVRMSDKISRLSSLMGRGGAVMVDESIEDTIGDLGAYCLLYLARPKEQPNETVSATGGY